VLTGTSIATLHGAGAAALFIGANPGATADAVRRALVIKDECVGGGATADGGPVCQSGWLYGPDGVWEPLTLGMVQFFLQMGYLFRLLSAPQSFVSEPNCGKHTQ
jgi:hypothetical protein